MLFDKPLSEITVEDIKYLIDNKISEQKTLEYKCQLPDKLPDKHKDEQKTKILQCITSFANTIGGIIIFGMKENDKGEASEIIGIETSTDGDFLCLQNLVKDRIEPRMAPPELRELIINDKKIYLMKIHSSYNRPHFVKNNFVFYGRHSNGKYPLDIGEIKSLFLFSKTTEEQFEQFRIQRIMKLKSGNFPFNYFSEIIATLHIASLSSLANKVLLSMSDLKYHLEVFEPINNFGFQGVNNFDGRLNYSFASNNKMHCYTQIFRNGIIEASNFGYYINDENKTFFAGQLECEIKETIENYIKNLTKLDVGFPYFISVSCLNVKGYSIRATDTGYHRNTDFPEIFENDLLLPTVYVENNDELSEKLGVAFDALWNSGGYPGNPFNGSN
jgi:hypothetical protein